jgi:hypothetical protein
MDDKAQIYRASAKGKHMEANGNSMILGKAQNQSRRPGLFPSPHSYC